MPDGRALDWSRTSYRNAWQADAMSDLVLVLLVNDGAGWRAIRHVIGPTDVAWYNWVEELGLPEALFFEEVENCPDSGAKVADLASTPSSGSTARSLLAIACARVRMSESVGIPTRRPISAALWAFTSDNRPG